MIKAEQMFVYFHVLHSQCRNAMNVTFLDHFPGACPVQVGSLNEHACIFQDHVSAKKKKKAFVVHDAHWHFLPFDEKH